MKLFEGVGRIIYIKDSEAYSQWAKEESQAMRGHG